MAMQALLKSIDAALPQIQQDPLSPRSTDTMMEMIEQIDQFLSSPVLRGASHLNAAERAMFGQQAQHGSDILRDMLSVADQLEDLGRGRAPWRSALANALGRLETTLRRRGLLVGRSTRKPHPIVAKVTATAEAPFLVATVTRRPELERYIALALGRACARELEPGHWYADLDGFPGVWADGESAEECVQSLGDVLHEWLLVKIAHRDRDIPVIDGMDPAALLHG